MVEALCFRCMGARVRSRFLETAEARGPDGVLPFSAVPPPQEPPAGPSEVEQRLQAEAEQLQKELQSLAQQLQAQVKDNESLSRLNQEQEQRLLELEQAARCWGEQAEECKQILESMQSDRTTISRALSQNRELKEQLAELQNGFVRLVRSPTRPACPPPWPSPLGRGEALNLSGALVFPPVKWVIWTFCEMVPTKARCEPESPAWRVVGGRGRLSYLPPPFPELWEADTKFWGLQLHWVAADCFSLCSPMRTWRQPARCSRSSTSRRSWPRSWASCRRS